MEDPRCSLSLSVLLLTVLLDSGAAGESRPAAEPRLSALPQTFPHVLRATPRRRATGDRAAVSRPA